MKTYFEVYRERLEKNQSDLLELAKQVKLLNPNIECYVHKSGLIKGVYFINGDTINIIHFHEVPYRWSGCGYEEHRNSHSGDENSSLPFNLNDVITTFKPIPNVKWYKDKESYLKWYSFLKPL